MEHRGDAPDGDGDGESHAGAVLIEQAAGPEHAKGIGRGEGAGDVAVLDIGPADGVLERLGEKAEHLPVDVVDGGGEEEERADGPADVRSGGRTSWGGGGQRFIICPRADAPGAPKIKYVKIQV